MRQLTSSDLEEIEGMLIARARVDFWCYRRLMNPKMKVGWFQKEVARILQNYYAKMMAGKRPMEVIQAPPQHGKSLQVVDFIAWVSGRHPELKTFYASFSDRLGVRANGQIQRMLDNPKHARIFPDLKIIRPGAIGTGYQRNRDQIDFIGKGGYFRNTTIQGPITGEGLDFGVLDDPIKGRQAANSPSVRDGSWDWLTDDFFTRFSEDGAFLSILTRWHVDDPIGRLAEQNPNLAIHSFKAIATEDERFRKKGEPLFPEHKSLEFLLQRKGILSEASWESLYQQSPFVSAGGIFPVDKFDFVDRLDMSEAQRSVRYWDKAGTKDGDGAETSGTLMHVLKNGRFVISSVIHGRWSYLEREQKIKATAQADGYRTEIYVEQEPGSGGKESAERTVIGLAGFRAYADRPTGDKALRAEPYAAQVQAGNVKLVRGEWNRPFLEEHEYFPYGKLKDMVDSSSGAFNKIAGSSYNMEALAS